MSDRPKTPAPPLTAEEQQATLERLLKRRSRLSPDEKEELRLVFPIVVDRHRPKVWEQLNGYGLGEQEKEDVVQETFAGAFLAICRHGLRKTLPTLLCSIASRRARNRWRSKARSPESMPLPSSGSEKAQPGQWGPDVAVDLLELERSTRERLEPEQWAAFDLVVLKGRSYAEAMKELHAPEQTLRSRVSRVKRVMCELLESSPPSSEGGKT